MRLHSPEEAGGFVVGNKAGRDASATSLGEIGGKRYDGRMYLLKGSATV